MPPFSFHCGADECYNFEDPIGELFPEVTRYGNEKSIHYIIPENKDKANDLKTEDQNSLEDKTSTYQEPHYKQTSSRISLFNDLTSKKSQVLVDLVCQRFKKRHRLHKDEGDCYTLLVRTKRNHFRWYGVPKKVCFLIDKRLTDLQSKQHYIWRIPGTLWGFGYNKLFYGLFRDEIDLTCPKKLSRQIPVSYDPRRNVYLNESGKVIRRSRTKYSKNKFAPANIFEFHIKVDFLKRDVYFLSSLHHQQCDHEGKWKHPFSSCTKGTPTRVGSRKRRRGKKKSGRNSNIMKTISVTELVTQTDSLLFLVPSKDAEIIRFFVSAIRRNRSDNQRSSFSFLLCKSIMDVLLIGILHIYKQNCTVQEYDHTFCSQFLLDVYHMSGRVISKRVDREDLVEFCLIYNVSYIENKSLQWRAQKDHSNMFCQNRSLMERYIRMCPTEDIDVLDIADIRTLHSTQLFLTQDGHEKEEEEQQQQQLGVAQKTFLKNVTYLFYCLSFREFIELRKRDRFSGLQNMGASCLHGILQTSFMKAGAHSIRAIKLWSSTASAISEFESHRSRIRNNNNNTEKCDNDNDILRDDLVKDIFQASTHIKIDDSSSSSSSSPYLGPTTLSTSEKDVCTEFGDQSQPFVVIALMARLLPVSPSRSKYKQNSSSSSSSSSSSTSTTFAHLSIHSYTELAAILVKSKPEKNNE